MTIYVLLQRKEKKSIQILKVPETDFKKFFQPGLRLSPFKLAFYDQQLLEILKSWTKFQVGIKLKNSGLNQ